MWDCICGFGWLTHNPAARSSAFKRLVWYTGAEDDEWDDEWDDMKSSGGYAESEAGEGGAINRGGAHGTSMKMALNKQVEKLEQFLHLTFWNTYVSAFSFLKRILFFF